MNVVGVIPARYASQRLKGKVLASIAGKPLIQHVYENARKAKVLNRLLVATDDKRVADACAIFGAEVCMTSSEHATGTDRLVEVASRESGDVFVNIQGDEPMIHPQMVEQVVGPFATDGSTQVATLITRIQAKEELDNPSVVKVVTDKNGVALYFSRSVIPFDRDGQQKPVYYRHLGIYAYRRDFLLSFSSLQPSKLEQAEKLEQLRILENGYRIQTVETTHRTIGVDTIEDLEQVRKILGPNPAGVRGR